MNIATTLVGAIFIGSVITSMLMAGHAQAEDSCGAWHPPDVDPTGGQFMLELRTCDLTYGLSAYMQIKNSGDDRIALSYRVVTRDDKHKESDIILEAATTVRAGNCQACAKRYAGFKSWEILSAKSLGKVAVVKAEVKAETKTEVPVAQPAVVPALPDKPKPEEKPVAAVAPPAPVAAAPVNTDNSAGQQKTVDKTPDGFKAEDGTIIPWDQLPPEFRPRK